MAMPWISLSTRSTAAFAVHRPSSNEKNQEQHIMQNFRLIWLDANYNESNKYFLQSSQSLRYIVNNIEVFTDRNRCIDFLKTVTSEKVFLISSGSLGEELIPEIHNMSQIYAIYILCRDKSRHERWTKRWAKIQGVFTDIKLIYDALKQATRQCDQDLIPISFVPPNVSSDLTNSDDLDASFMYTQLLKETFLEIHFGSDSVHRLTNYISNKLGDNTKEIEIMKKFAREYWFHTPIWWYTCESCLYSMLNRALRMFEIDTILQMAFFLRDIHRHIQKLYQEQFFSFRQRFTVYRGQGLSKRDFEKLQKMKGGLISFNNFLSTSKEDNVARQFARRALENPEFVGTVFIMTIDPSISSTPFARVDKVSYFKDSEKEILFSMHTVFRIGDIHSVNDSSHRLYEVQLVLVSDNDTQLSTLTKRIRNDAAGFQGWDRLGELLIRMGQHNKAEYLYQVLLTYTTMEPTQAFYYTRLGIVNREQGKYQEALSFLKTALEIYRKYFPPNHIYLAESYTTIATIYSSLGDYTKAQSSHEKAMNIWRQLLPQNHSNLALAYTNYSKVYLDMGDYAKALSTMQKALEIQKISLPQTHPDLAISYNNIGIVYYRMGDYAKASSAVQKALEIRQISLPPNHPDLAAAYNSIGMIYLAIGNYEKALSTLKKGLEIWKQSMPSNHPNLAMLYTNIGNVQQKMNEYSEALVSHEEALNILKQMLPPNHPNFALIYNNIGIVYFEKGDDSKALSYFQKALEIHQKNFSPNHPECALCYNNIGNVYSRMGNYTEAISAHEKVLDIWKKALPPNHPDLAAPYNNIGSSYYHMGNYSKALPFYQHALEIGKRSLPANHPMLQIFKENIEKVKKELGF